MRPLRTSYVGLPGGRTGRLIVLVILVSAAVALISAQAETANATGIDLSTWTPESYPQTCCIGGSPFPIAEWKTDAKSAQQNNNGQPTVLYSDFNAASTNVEIHISAKGGTDDNDYFGFAIGFQPGDASPGNSQAEYLLVDWKKADQFYDLSACTPGATAFAGLSVALVRGMPTGDEFWGHTNFDSPPCSDLSSGLEELARAANLGSTGWEDDTEYVFTYQFEEDHLDVFVDGVLELSVTGSFQDGRLAFYNYSQAQVNYRAVATSSCPIVPDLPFPDAGCDIFQSTASVEVKLTNPPLDPLDCLLQGPTTVTRGPVVSKPPDSVDTELIFMDLVGICQPGSLEVTLRESPTLDSLGRIDEQKNNVPGTLEFPADSFFDIFFQVDTPVGTLHNQDPLTLSCKINIIPPLGCSYLPDVGSIQLFYDSGKLAGTLNHAEHMPLPKVTVRAGSGTTPPGGTLTIPVDVLLNPPTINQGTFTVEVKYDPEVVAGVECTPNPDGIWDFGNCSPNFAPGVARCTGVSISGLSGAELSLCDIIFHVFPDAPFGGKVPLAVNCIVKTDPAGEPILCNPQDGAIQIGLQGDASCDGLVNVVDALFILQHEVGLRLDSGPCLLPEEPPPPPALGWLFLDGGDVNKDGVTNVVDALFILQCEVGAKPGANMDFCIAAKSALSVGG